MRQITIEFPIDTLPPYLIPEHILAITPSVKFLELDINGFLFTFRVKPEESKETVKLLRKHYEQVQEGTVKITHEGQGILLVSGKWVDNGKYLWKDYKGYLSNEKGFSRWMTIYQTKTFWLRSPEVSGNTIRFVVACDPETVKTVMKTLKGLDIPYNLRNISSFKTSGDSVFDRLTLQQTRILRLAYAEGYYSIPRKITTEQLASLLKMEKGNVGEHLRRAEKNIMDFLMTA